MFGHHARTAITDIILIAVSITVAVSIALWISNLTLMHTRFEKIEVENQGVERSSSNGEIEVWFKVRNRGPSTVTINMLLINGEPAEHYVDSFNSTGNTFQPFTLESGEEVTYKLIDTDTQDTKGFRSGAMYEFTFHTAKGNNFKSNVKLP